MNVTSPALDTLRANYSRSVTRAQEVREQLDTAQLESNKRADAADKVANKINRLVKVRQALPYVGMGSLMTGIVTTNLGVSLVSPVLLGIGLTSWVVCGACILGIETMKHRMPRIRAEHDGLLAHFNAQQRVVSGLQSQHSAALAEVARDESALRAEEASIEEIQRMLKPDRGTGVAEQSNAVVVGGVRVPKRPMPDRKSLF